MHTRKKKQKQNTQQRTRNGRDKKHKRPDKKKRFGKRSSDRKNSDDNDAIGRRYTAIHVDCDIVLFFFRWLKNSGFIKKSDELLNADNIQRGKNT